MVEIEGKITRNLSIEEERKVTRFLDAIAEAYCRHYYEEDRAQLEADYDALKANEQVDKACDDC